MDNNNEDNKTAELADTHLSSAAAFVEGGIQEACEDACSICLDPFSHNDPSTVTTCKHEYHLQCILDWSQRSRQCPMCWQLLSLKDPASQDLLEAVENEKISRLRRPQNLSNFHPTLFEDFNLHNVPINADELDFEEHVMQHLAGMAAMSRAHQFARRGTPHNRSSAHGHPHFILPSSNPNMLPPTPVSNSPASQGGNSPALTADSPITSLVAGEGEQLERASQSTQVESDFYSARSAIMPTVPHRNVAGLPSIKSQGRAGPSEMQSFSESLKCRFSAMSARYKESISKTTRGFKDRLWVCNTSMRNPGQEAQRAVTTGIGSVAHMVEHLDLEGKNRRGITIVPKDTEGSSGNGPSRQHIYENHGKMCSGNNIGVNLCPSSSGSSRVAPQPLNSESSSSMDTSSLKDVEDNSGGGTGVQRTM
ncbi:E3 ubiquitin-protein ligase RHF2A [Cryptomeria japonica]|uniref:E3 ubiquitin-protein ligase RHF2A n=1 Tax=Cryptomeria japonica TaxID=3369 RepID=UPI0027DA2E62|nr:E3 ubiquitin-protein ligase RHF2A [Cryptomeria japonica]XP_057845132.2 E3 ubiquitin-protein ligase RHF2A [Cryptomeria japonica]